MCQPIDGDQAAASDLPVPVEVFGFRFEAAENPADPSCKTAKVVVTPLANAANNLGLGGVAHDWDTSPPSDSVGVALRR